MRFWDFALIKTLAVISLIALVSVAQAFIFPRREYSTHSRQAWVEMRGATRYPALRCASAISL
jgi:L-asparagine transporter-like permease